MSPHPRRGLDEAFQTPIRFSLMAALRDGVEIDFRTLRDLLEAGDSVLSKAIAHLERAEYVKTKKGFVGNRPRTWIMPTKKGLRAFRQHLDALRAIAEGFPEP